MPQELKLLFPIGGCGGTELVLLDQCLVAVQTGSGSCGITVGIWLDRRGENVRYSDYLVLELSPKGVSEMNIMQHSHAVGLTSEMPNSITLSGFCPSACNS